MTRMFVCLAAVLLADSTTASGQGWGALSGRFVVQGEAPPPMELAPGNDPVCHAAAPVDQSVLVGPTGGLKNALVYLRPRRGEALPLPPCDADSLATPVVLTNRQCAFSPRVCVLRTGQPLVVKNADPTPHNTKLDLLRNTAINQLIPPQEDFTVTLTTAERLPTAVSCSIHPFMRGYVLVRDDPYAAVSDERGRFRIENLPAGEHQFQLWHETGYLKEAATAVGAADRRGRVRLTIPADGELDLGTIPIPLALLARQR